MRLPPFQALLDEHRADVYRFLVALVGPEEAEDCLQETFLAALRAYPRLDSNANLRGWLFTIAHRKGLDAHRRRAREPVLVESLPERAEPPPREPADGTLWTAVRSLPPKQRAAVAHRFVGDLAYREIGEAMGTTEEAARRSVHEGLRKLREVWSP